MDEMDHYIERCLKNWTARYPAPATGRDELLRRAAQPSAEVELWILRWLGSIRVRVRTNADPVYPHSHFNFLSPSTLSTLWSFHLVTSQRLAT